MDDLENRNDEMNGVDQPYQTPDNDGSVSREPVADDIPGTVNESVPPESYSDPASAPGGSYPYSDSGNSAGGQASYPYGPNDPSNGGYPYGPNGANNGGYPYGKNNVPDNGGYPYGSNGGYGGSYNGGGQRQSGTGSYPYGSYAPKQPAGNGKPPKAPKKKTGAGTVVLVVLLCVALIVAGIGVTAAILAGKKNGSGGISENSGIHEEIETKAGVNEGPSLTINDTPSAPASSGEVLSATDIYNKVCDSSVGILVYEAKSTSVSSEGSGVVMAIENGRTYIVTCAHVIDTAGAEIYVTPYDSETKFKAEVIGYDVRTDLGVISVESTDFTAAEFGDVSKLLVGQTVYAIGNPGGTEFANSFTSGIVSAISRPISSETGYTMKCIQHTAAINPGNSGGALVNEYGQVIGINSMKIVQEEYEGMGFAVPSDVVESIVNSLISNGYVPDRPKLGIKYRPASYYNVYNAVIQLKNLPQGSIIIEEIDSDSPLKATDAQAHDMIIRANGKDLERADTLKDIIDGLKVGDKLTLTLVRVNRDYSLNTFDVTVELVEDKGTAVEETTEPPTTSIYDYYFGENGDGFGFDFPF